MSKQEFIDKLRMALSGKVSARLVEENVSYYEEYINAQMRQGYSEESVMESLGDPRLIARSIITANTGETTQDADYRAYGESNDEGYYAQKRQQNSLKVMNMPGWLMILIVILILCAIISIVGSIVSALLPIVLPVILVVFLVKLFRDWLN